MADILAGELVVKALKENGIETAFGLVGNQISPIMVYAEKYGIEIIGTRHEQGAILMADGWAQVKRSTGVAMVSGGPGFSNCVSSIIKAYFAQTPILIIVGAAVTSNRECNELQDLEQVGFIKQYTKWSATIGNPLRIKEYIAKALYLAKTGKRGPVVLEIPINVLKTVIEEEQLIEFNKINASLSVNESGLSIGQINFIVQQLNRAERPVLVVGDSAYYAFAEESLKDFAECVKVPIYTIGKARGMLQDTHPCCFGNGRVLDAGAQLYALENADFIFCLGVTDNYEMNLSSCDLYDKNAVVVNVDLEFQENIFRDQKLHLFFQANVCSALKQVNALIQQNGYKIDCNKWMVQIAEQSEKINQGFSKDSGNGRLHPLYIIKSISRVIQEMDSIVVLDGSNAMFWGTYGFEFNQIGAFINGPDGNLGPMGCGLALALGAKAAAREKKVVLYTGDGSFGFNICELDTAKKYNLPITIVVHNDKAWGLCKSTQEILYGSTANVDLELVRYDQIVKAFGGEGMLVEELTDGLETKITDVLKSDELFCFNILFPEKIFSPGTIAFNKMLEKMK